MANTPGQGGTDTGATQQTAPPGSLFDGLVDENAGQEDPGFFKRAWEWYKQDTRNDIDATYDLFRSPAIEAVNFFNETANFFGDVLTPAAKAIKGFKEKHPILGSVIPGQRGATSDLVLDVLSDDAHPANIPQPFKPYRTTTGAFIGTAERFVYGALLLGPTRAAATATGETTVAALGPRLTQAIAKHPRVAAWLGRTSLVSAEGGALTAALLDPNEHTLAELAQQWGGSPEWLQDVTAWMASDEDDTDLERRIKNGIEGAVATGVAESIIFPVLSATKWAISSVRQFNAGKADAGAAALARAEESLARVESRRAPRPDDAVEAVDNLVVERGTRPERDIPDLWEAPGTQTDVASEGVDRLLQDKSINARRVKSIDEIAETERPEWITSDGDFIAHTWKEGEGFTHGEQARIMAGEVEGASVVEAAGQEAEGAALQRAFDSGMIRLYRPQGQTSTLSVEFSRKPTARQMNQIIEAARGFDEISIDGTPGGSIEFKSGRFETIGGSFEKVTPGKIRRAINAMDLPDPPAPTSLKTTRPQVASGFKRVEWKPGTKNIDIGGGKYDKGTEYAAGQGVESAVYDPFNRTKVHNDAVVASHGNGQSDTATIFNTLNVIRDAPDRIRVLQQAENALKDGGTLYVQVYEGTKGGVGMPTTNGWQNNRRLATYLDEVKQVFPDAKIEGGLIVAHRAPRGRVIGTFGSPEEATAKAFTLNDHMRVEVAPVNRLLTPENQLMIQTYKAEIEAAVSRSSAEEVDQLLNQLTTDLNLARSVRPGEDKEIVAAILQEMGPLPHRTLQPNAKTGAYALDMLEGASERDLMAELAKYAEFGDDLPQKLVGFKIYLNIKAQRVSLLGEQLLHNADDATLWLRYDNALNQLFTITRDVSRITTGAARATQAGNINIPELIESRFSYAELSERAFNAADVISKKGLLDVMSGLSPRERLSIARKLAAAQGNPKMIQRIVVSDRLMLRAMRENASRTQLERLADAVNNYQITGLLSNPKTHFVNTFGNALMAFLRPTANLFGGAVHYVYTGGDASVMRKGLDLYVTSFRAIGDSWKLAKESFLTGEVTLDPFRTLSELEGAAIGSDFAHAPGDLRPMTTWSKFKSLATQYPTRGLKAGDELFKAIAYKSEVASEAMGRARANGVDDWQQLLAIGDQATLDNVSVWGEATNTQALKIARYQTFQGDMGKLGHLLQRAVNALPYGTGRWLFPFVRTPGNITRTSFEYHPGLNLISHEVRNALANGSPQERAEVLGRMMIGMTAIVSLYGAWQAGVVTGGGPRDPKLRDLWKHDPYTFTAGDVSFRYDRIEPLGTVLAFYPDLFDTIAEAQAAGLPWQDAATAVTLSMMKRLEDRTFFRQFVLMMNVIYNPADQPSASALKRFGRGMAPRVLPHNALLRGVAQGIDPYQREVRSMIDALQSSIPGFSQNLPVARNIAGQPIMRTPMNTTAPWDMVGNFVNTTTMPFTISVPVSGTLEKELRALRHGFSMPSEKLSGTDISLVDPRMANDRNQTPYDRMLEIVEEMDLMGRLEAEVSKPSYQQLPGDNFIERGGLRWRRLNNIINGVHQQAQERMLDEWPELRQQRQQYYDRLGASRRGGQDELERLLESQGGR